MSRLRHWFIPSPSGDLRLEEVPDLDTLSADDARRTWPAHPPGGCVLDVLNPKVRVRRGALGAFFLEFEGSNRSPKVRRVQ